MNYYESVVIDYLRADRAIFVNTECCIQVGPISYSVQLAALIKRIKAWHDNWDSIRVALARESHLPSDWLLHLRPWLFVPEEKVSILRTGLDQPGNGAPVFTPRITTLEMVQPWLYCSWDRVGERAKPPCIPEAMAN